MMEKEYPVYLRRYQTCTSKLRGWKFSINEKQEYLIHLLSRHFHYFLPQTVLIMLVLKVSKLGPVCLALCFFKCTAGCWAHFLAVRPSPVTVTHWAA